MGEARSRQVIIAGAGIAGLTAALAFAQRGFSVQVFERAPKLDEAGAGLQLSPNATRILARLGVLDHLLPATVRPEFVQLLDAKSLTPIATVPLGTAGEARWKAPYLVAHRADLQSALLARVSQEPDIRLVTGAMVKDVAIHSLGVTVSVDIGGKVIEPAGLLLVGADGVWSTLRGLAGDAGQSRFSGMVAWRTTVRAESPAGRAFASIAAANAVTTFLHRSFHLVAYPVRGGGAINLVAIAKAPHLAKTWSGSTDPALLKSVLRDAAPALVGLQHDAAPWTAWPLHTVDPEGPWTGKGRLALIGDAAHALTPFAAQGAAMAIEDAVTLAGLVAAAPGDVADALNAYEATRRPRVEKVARRGALNHFAWHAAGPVAIARNMFLKLRAPQKLAADLDWLYGFDAERPKR